MSRRHGLSRTPAQAGVLDLLGYMSLKLFVAVMQRQE